MKSNKITLLAVFAASIGLSFQARTASADLIYAFENHVFDQNGHVLSGTIRTTDTAINDGELVASEILAWSWSVTGPNPASASSSSAGAATLVTGIVAISATEITLPEPNIMSDDTYSLELNSNSGNIIWSRQDQFGALNEFYAAANSWATSSPGMSGTSPWLVATVVPEPSGVLVAGVGFLIGGSIFLGRRRRDQA